MRLTSDFFICNNRKPENRKDNGYRQLRERLWSRDLQPKCHSLARERNFVDVQSQ